MQAFTKTSMQVRGSDRISPQQSPSSLQPASSSQSGYYSGQRMPLNAYNTTRPYGNSYVPSFHPNSTSSNFQSSPPIRSDLPGPQQTFSSQMPAPSSQPAYHSMQQRMQFSNQVSPGVRNGQFSYSLSQPSSDSANSQPSQGQFSVSLTPMHYRPSGSSNAPCPNVTAHVQEIPINHQKVPSVQLNYYAQSSHAPFQDYKNMPHGQNGQVVYTSTSFSSVPSSGVPVLETNQQHVSVPLRYQTHGGMQTMHQPAPQPQQMATNANQTVQIINANQGQMTGVRNDALYGSTAQPPTIAQMPTVPSVPPAYRGNHNLVNQGQFQNSVNPVQNSTVSMDQRFWLQVLEKLRSLVQSKSEQNASQSSPVSSVVQNPPTQAFNNVSQGVQTRQATQHCNPVPFSDRPNKVNLPSFPANQYNTEPQGLQANRTMNVLSADSQNTVSRTSPSGEASLPARSGNFEHSKVTLLTLLLGQKNGQVPRHDGRPISNSISGQQRTIAGQPASGAAECTQAQAPPTTMLHCAVPPNPSETEVLMVSSSTTKGKGAIPVNAAEHGSHSKASLEFRRSKVNSATGKRDQKTSRKRNREVELCTNPADCLELVAALQKAARQVHRAVAVVPPISQQADSGKKKDDSKEIDRKQSETKAPSPPKETSEELLQTQNSVKPVNESPVSTRNNEGPLPGNPSATDSQNIDSAQTENGPISKAQSPTLVQASISFVDLTAKSPEQPNDRNANSSDDAMFDFSTLPVFDCTLDHLQTFIVWLSLKCIDTEKEKDLGTDVIKRIVNLYWDGDITNYLKAVKVADWAKNVEEMSLRNKEDVVFQSVEPENLKRLACHYIMDEHEPILPAKKFKSSWLNVEEIPPDLDKVLAEPILDYHFTWWKDSSLSVSDGTLLPVDSQVQVNAAEGPVVSTQDISDNNTVNPLQGVVQVVSPKENISEVTSGGTAVSPQDSLDVADQVESIEKELSVITTIDLTEDPVLIKESSKITSENALSSDMFSPSQMPTLESESNDVVEPRRLIENKQTPKEVPAPASHLSDSDPLVKSDGNGYEKEVLSSADSSSDDISMHVELLSTDDATAIFKVQEEPPELCPEEAVFTISHLVNLFNITEVRPSRPPKFACPHVTDKIRDGVNFCSKCLDETPLLDVDLDDSLLSPEEDGPSVSSNSSKPDSGSCSPNSGFQTETEEIIELSSPDPDGLISPMSDSSEDPFAPDQSVSLESTEPVSGEINQMNELKSSAVVKVHKGLGQTKKAEEVKPSQTKGVPLLKYKPFKKNKLSKTKRIPTEDVLFAPDIVIFKKHSSHKEHSDNHRPASGGNSKSSRDKTNEGRREEKSSPIKTDAKTSAKPETSKSQKTKGPESSTRSNSDPSQHQDNGCKKQTVRRLSLYGARDPGSVFIHQCHDREKSSSAPVCIKISSANKGTDSGKNYSDELSAKQKIYTQWRSSLVEKQKTSSHKRKRQSKNELKKVIELQKNVMRERSTSKSENEKSPQAKKLKFTVIEDYFGST